MSPISLGSDAPTYLPEVLHTYNIRIDHIKVGLWQGAEGARREAAVVPGLPVLLHGDLHLAGAGLIEPRELDELAALVEETATRWFSAHLEYRTAAEFEALRAGGYTAPDLPRDEAAERILRRVEQLKSALQVPLLLENMSHWPAATHDLAADPTFINDVLRSTGCRLLLDVAHARVAAERLGTTDEEYLASLPLNRVVEIHASGPRLKNGVLRDMHEPLQPRDYDLVAWLLSRATPQALTLEYWKDPAAHGEQLIRLRELVATSR